MGWKDAGFGCLIACLGGGVMAASSVDDSLDEIAGQIVERTRSDGTATIGISTFTHSDGTCSDLSNYISEFVVDSLFNAGEGKIDIIERSQLSAIFREMELVFDGTIAPDAAKRLGEIEGVDALVTGSLIQFGEQVKLQARMISTQDGRLFATARSEFPSVGSVAQMMATRSRTTCGFSDAEHDGGATPTTQVVVVESGQQVTQGAMTASSRQFTSAVFEAEVTSLVASKSGELNLILRFRNTQEVPIALSYVEGSLTVTDRQGQAFAYKNNWAGIPGCYSLSRKDLCNGSDSKYGTVVAPGQVVQLRFTMEGAKNLESPLITLGMDLVVTPDISDGKTHSVTRVNFFDMTPDG